MHAARHERAHICMQHAPACSRARIRMGHAHATRAHAIHGGSGGSARAGRRGDGGQSDTLPLARTSLPLPPPHPSPSRGSPARIAAIGSPDDRNSAVCRFSCAATRRKPRRDRDQRIWLGECGASPSVVLSAGLRRGGVPAPMWALRTETQRTCMRTGGETVCVGAQQRVRADGSECSPNGLNELGSSGMPEDLERGLRDVPRQWFGRSAWRWMQRGNARGGGCSTAMRVAMDAARQCAWQHRRTKTSPPSSSAATWAPLDPSESAQRHECCCMLCATLQCHTTPHVALQLIVPQAQAQAHGLRLPQETCRARTGSEFCRICQRAHRSLAHS